MGSSFDTGCFGIFDEYLFSKEPVFSWLKKAYRQLKKDPISSWIWFTRLKIGQTKKSILAPQFLEEKLKKSVEKYIFSIVKKFVEFIKPSIYNEKSHKDVSNVCGPF